MNALFTFTFCSADASNIEYHARYVNDSISGNCKIKKDKVQSVEHLCLFDTKAISPGNEMRQSYVNDCKIMSKVGRLISAEDQLCYAHGVQLAVVNVLYKRNASFTSATSVTVSSKPDEGDSNGEEEDCEVEQDFEVSEDNYDVLVELPDIINALSTRCEEWSKCLNVLRRRMTIRFSRM